MDEKISPPSRLTPSAPRGKKIALIIIGAVVAVLLIGYLALCLVAQNTTVFFPRTTITLTGLVAQEGDGGRLDVSGMTPEAAGAAIAHLESTWYGEATVPVTYGDGTFDFSGKGVTVGEPGTLASLAFSTQHGGGFIGGGISFLRALFFGTSSGIRPVISEYGTGELNSILASLGRAVENPVSETSFRVTADDLVVQKGAPGLSIDRALLEQDLVSAFWTYQFAPIVITPLVTDPQPADLDAIVAQILVEPKDSTLDPTTYTITPHITGISVDAAALKRAFDATADGGDCTLPLVKTAPNMTAEKLEASLFRDLLGEATSNVGGSSNRASNVTLSAKACDGRIMLPGDVFSYNTTTGSRTAAAGYRPAPAYVGGKSVDELGGGICQTSSTIYYAVLKANLKIVERHNHMFAVGYVPDGMDATVYFGSSDFLFENNTPSPIKIVLTSEGRVLTAKIYGTKQDKTYVKMENERLSTTGYETVYKPDPSLAAGSTRVEQTPYTGRKVNAYRCLYGADDKLISRTLESVNVYQSRNKIVLFNPADAGAMGLDPATGAPLGTPTVVPVDPTATPGVTPPVSPETPAPVDPAAPTPSANPSPGPEPTAPPVVTPPPVPSVTPSPVATPPVETPPPGIPIDPAPTAPAAPVAR